MKNTALSLVLLMLTVSCASAAVTLVADGRPQAVIVLPDEPLPVVAYAAEELVYHVAAATGVTLEVVSESAIPDAPPGRVFLGDTQAARARGLDARELEPEVFTLRTADGELYIVGRDSDGAPLSVATWAGTLFGVYQLLEDHLQVLWLWPGELGEIIPQSDTVTIPDLDRTVPPRLVQRNLRSTLNFTQGNPDDGFSPQALAKARNDEAKFLRRHRQGKSLRLRYGHAFTNWWDLYGETNPEYFNLLPSGNRIEPGWSGHSLSMCVSNPGFHQQIIDNWLAERAQNPGENIVINCCENDVYGRCTCETCLSWDVERPDTPISERYDARIVSDRYARFYKTVHEMAVQHDPEAIVTAYAYVNYALPPVEVTLNENIFIGMVPDVFFPRTDEEHRWVLDMWDGWRKTGARLFLRPNYTLDGYCMPYIYIGQYADEFAHCARNGMVATDYDSLTAMWATQGPQMYLLARWPNLLDEPLETVLSEYYSGFGPAQQQVRAYFEYWEEYLLSNLQMLREAAGRNNAGWSSFPRMAYDTFPPEALAAGRELLEAAMQAAGDDPQAAARVTFLEKGLTHAEKCSALAAARASGRFRDLHLAMTDLRAYRRSIEMDNVVNLNYCSWLEFRAWGATRDVAYTGEPLRPIAETVAEVELKPYGMRQSHGFVAILGAGERFRAHLACMMIGRNTVPLRWSLASADGEVVEEGVLQPGEEADLDIAVPAPGVYNLIADPGANSARVTLQSNHTAMIGKMATFIFETAPMYIYVPEGTTSFKITLESPAPGETARLTIFDPTGAEVAGGETGEKAVFAPEVAVPPGMDGKAWGLVISPAATGVFEDYTLRLPENIPPYWAPAADRLVVPE